MRMDPDHVKARLDADRKAKPKTRLLGRVVAGKDGTCFAGPGDTHEDLETGKRTPLDPAPDYYVRSFALGLYFGEHPGLNIADFILESPDFKDALNKRAQGLMHSISRALAGSPSA